MPAYNFAYFLVEKLFRLQNWALEVATTGMVEMLGKSLFPHHLITSHYCSICLKTA